MRREPPLDRLGTSGPDVDAARLGLVGYVTDDVGAKARDSQPDSGAYEY